MNNFLVTGAAGFVGSNLALTLQEKYPDARIVVIDDFSSGHWENLKGFKGELYSYKLGFNMDEDIFKIFDFHVAAITDTTVHDPVEVVKRNVHATQQIAQWADACNARLIYSSSSAVYGKHPERKMVVGKNENPLNIYAFSKLTGERVARRYCLDTTCLRYFNVYGPGELHKGNAASMIYKIWKQLKGCNSEVRPICLFRDSLEKKRDWIHVDDIVQANLTAMEAEPGTYNVGTGKPTKFVDLVRYIGEAMNLNVQIKWNFTDNPTPQYYQDFTCAGIKSTKSALKSFSPISIEEGIKSYVEWLGANER
jgi:ADP-L-glycero-D-manno-heptose 6-epimerase